MPIRLFPRVQSALQMWFESGSAGAQLTLLAATGITGGARN
jgi:hypothetical protein